MAARAVDAVEYSSFASEIDLYSTKGRDIEKLRIVSASGTATITVRTADSGETERTYTVAQGEELAIQIRAIVSVSNVTKVRAEFGAF